MSKLNNDLLAEIRAIESLNEVAKLRHRRERADSISRECTRRIIELIQSAKDDGRSIKAIAESTGYTPTYIKSLLAYRCRP